MTDRYIRASDCTMNGRGEIVLNHQVWEAMGKPEAAALLFDPDTDTIGVKPASPLMPHAFPVKPKGDCKHRRIMAHNFAAKHDIRLDGTVRFSTAAIENGILVLELRKIVNAGRRPKKAARR